MNPRKPGRPPREAVTPIGTFPASRCRVCSAPGVLLAPGVIPSAAIAVALDAVGLDVLFKDVEKKRICTQCWLAREKYDTSDTEPRPGPPAKLTAPPKRGGARPGAGRPRKLEPPEGSPEIRVRLDQPSGLALLRYRQSLGVEGPAVAGAGVASAIVRELLTAWGDSANVREAVEAWRSEQGDEGKMWFGRPVKSAKKERGA